jgi:NADH-quinone oxidoreductase subunit H
MAWWNNLPAVAQAALLSTLWILAVTIVLILCVAYLTLAERKVIGWMQVRKGPNRVRIFGLPFTAGLGQPFADVVKLLIKEVVVPSRSNSVLFRLAPAITLIPAFAIWAVIPIAPGFDFGGRVWRDPGRLGFQLQVRLPRGHAFRGADRCL